VIGHEASASQAHRQTLICVDHQLKEVAIISLLPEDFHPGDPPIYVMAHMPSLGGSRDLLDL